MAFDYKGARDAGYSDAEIIEGVAKSTGKTVDVQGALKAGYTAEEVIAGLTSGGPAKSTGFVDATRQGAADVVGGLGETAEQYLGKGKVSDALKGAAQTVGPDNYDRARLYSDKEGFTPSNAPRAVAEALPGLAGTATAYRLGSKAAGWKGGALAAALTSLGLSSGNEAKRSADARTGTEGTEPEAQDKARALLYGVPAAALDATGAGRLVSGAAKGVGASGVGSALRNYATKVGTEAATEGAQEALAQAGSTIGTKDGVRFNPEDIIDNTLRGGATGATYAAPKALKETANATRLRNFGGDNADASTDVANRLTQASGDDLSNTKTAAKAFKDVSSDLHNELLTAVKSSRASADIPDDPAVSNTLARAQKGEALNSEDRDALAKSNIPGEVKAIVRRISVLAELKKQNVGDGDNFKGGLSARAEKSVRALVNPVGTGVGAALATAGLTGNAALMGSTALPGLAAVAGGYGAARVVDRFTGARSPLNRFAKQFADGQVPQRSGPAQTAPVDDGPVPWGPWNNPPAPQVGAFGKGARPPEPGPQEPLPTGPWNMPPQPQVAGIGQGTRPAEAPPAPPPPQFDARAPEMRDALASVKMLMKMRAEQAERDTPPPPAPEAPPGTLPPEVLEALKGMRGRIKMKSKALAAEQEPAPIDDGTDIPAFLPNRQDIPAFLPARAPEAAPPPPVVTKVTKANGKVNKKVAAAKAVQKMAEPVVDAPVMPAPVAEIASPIPRTVEKTSYVPDAAKTNFKTVEGDDAFPFHDKHDLSPEEFGKAMGTMRAADGKFTSPEYEAGTARRVDAKYKLADAIVAAAPKLPLAKIRSQLLVVDSVAKAEAYRTHLLSQVKTVKAKAALMTAFSNEAISSAWKRSRKK